MAILRRDNDLKGLLAAQSRAAELVLVASDTSHAAGSVLRLLCDAFRCGRADCWISIPDEEEFIRVASIPRAGENGESLARGLDLQGVAQGDGSEAWTRVVRGKCVLPLPDLDAAGDASLTILAGVGAQPLVVLRFRGGGFAESRDDGPALLATSAARLLMARIEQERRDDAQRRSILRRAAILEASPEAIVTVDHLGVVVDMNPASERLTGYRTVQAIGRSFEELMVPSRLREEYRQTIARIREAESQEALTIGRFETALLRANGKELPVELSMAAAWEPSGVVVTSLIRDLSERKNREDRARRAQQLRDELLGLISHEVRSPLATIKGNAALLAKQSPQPEDLAFGIAEIQGGAERLERVVGNMLLLARLETRQEIETEPVLVQRLLVGVVDSYRARHPEREVLLEIDPNVPPANAEPTFLEQIVENLLSNADKYSPSGRPIRVGVGLRDTWVEITVENEGEKLSAGEVAHLFDPFFRAASASGQAPGLGLGLTVCKRLAEAQDGRISARPNPEGGMTFVVGVPLLR